MHNRIKSLSGIRFISAFFIAYIYHYMIFFRQLPPMGVVTKVIYIFSWYGYRLPDIFFMMSGYLMVDRYESAIANRSMSFKEYFLPKVKKLFPTMWITVLITFFLEWYSMEELGRHILFEQDVDFKFSFISLLINLCGLQCGWLSDIDELSINGPAWFISILLLCYILFYIMAGIKRDGVRNACYVCVVLISGGLLICPVRLPLLYTCAVRGYMTFFLGMLQRKLWSRLERTATAKKCLYLYYLVTFAVCIGDMILRSRRSWDFTPLIVFELFFFPALLYFSVNGKILPRFFSLRPLEYMGKYSLSLFLWNVPVAVTFALLNAIGNLNMDFGCWGIYLLQVAVWMMISVLSEILISKMVKSMRKESKGVHGETT